MLKLYSDIYSSEKQCIQKDMTTKFGYLSMMTVTTLGTLNVESLCEHVLSCVQLVVSDIHVGLKTSEIRMLVMIRMTHEFMEYMSVGYPNTPLSDFKSADVYVQNNGGLDSLEEDEEDEE